jgi:hypothetical protein
MVESESLFMSKYIYKLWYRMYVAIIDFVLCICIRFDSEVLLIVFFGTKTTESLSLASIHPCY